MSRIVATDLDDALLQRHAPNYLGAIESWILEQAETLGVAEEDVLPSLGRRAKRASVYQLAIFICVGESAQNQHGFGADGKDAYSEKLKMYRDLQKDLLPNLGAADWSGSTSSEDASPANNCPRLFRA